MTTTIITIAVCLMIMGMAVWYYSAACKTYDKADRLRIEAEATKETHEEMMKFKNSMIAICEPLAYRLREGDCSYTVLAEYKTLKNGETTENVIKRFPFGDDRDFALLEAQELLDHLNEK